MNIKYYSLYKEKDGEIINYIIPIRESKGAWAVEGFVYNSESWKFSTNLVNPDDWEEYEFAPNDYLKIIPIEETPDKRQLIKLIMSIK